MRGVDRTGKAANVARVESPSTRPEGARVSRVSTTPELPTTGLTQLNESTSRNSPVRQRVQSLIQQYENGNKRPASAPPRLQTIDPDEIEVETTPVQKDKRPAITLKEAKSVRDNLLQIKQKYEASNSAVEKKQLFQNFGQQLNSEFTQRNFGFSISTEMKSIRNEVMTLLLDISATETQRVKESAAEVLSRENARPASAPPEPSPNAARERMLDLINRPGSAQDRRYLLEQSRSEIRPIVKDKGAVITTTEAKAVFDKLSKIKQDYEKSKGAEQKTELYKKFGETLNTEFNQRNFGEVIPQEMKAIRDAVIKLLLDISTQQSDVISERKSGVLQAKRESPELPRSQSAPPGSSSQIKSPEPIAPDIPTTAPELPNIDFGAAAASDERRDSVSSAISFGSVADSVDLDSHLGSDTETDLVDDTDTTQHSPSAMEDAQIAVLREHADSVLQSSLDELAQGIMPQIPDFTDVEVRILTDQQMVTLLDIISLHFVTSEDGSYQQLALQLATNFVGVRYPLADSIPADVNTVMDRMRGDTNAVQHLGGASGESEA